MVQEFEIVIGLEVHIRLNTKTKAFCADANQFGSLPNNHISPISLAHPGTLPSINRVHIEKAIKLGLALDCEINKSSSFDRKHYMYPDLPKGYQITQQNNPICLGGKIELHLSSGVKTVRINHIHIEEDAGKSIHDGHPDYSLIDLNRAGIPLLELVTEPDMRSGEEVQEFISELQKIVRYIDVSDGDMEKGSIKCDCNVSVRPLGQIEYGQRVEIKNVNSKKFARQAVEFEAKRQIEAVLKGETIRQQTMQFDPKTGRTSSMRDKEDENDYRYFKDPDLPVVTLNQRQIDVLHSEMPKLPKQVRQELVELDGLSDYEAGIISGSRDIVEFYNEVKVLVVDKKSIVKLIINKILPACKDLNVELDAFPVPKKSLVDFVTIISEEKITHTAAYQLLFPQMIKNPQASIDKLAEELNLFVNEDITELESIVEGIINANPAQTSQYIKGKKNLFGFFMGQLMKKTKSKFNPEMMKAALTKKLEEM